MNQYESVWISMNQYESVWIIWESVWIRLALCHTLPQIRSALAKVPKGTWAKAPQVLAGKMQPTNQTGQPPRNAASAQRVPACWRKRRVSERTHLSHRSAWADVWWGAMWKEYEGIILEHILFDIIWIFAIILLYYLYLIVFICVYTIYYLWIITVQPSYYYSTCYDITGRCIVCVFLCLSNWCPNIPTIEARLLSRSCPSQTFSYCCEKEAGIGNLQDILNQIVLDHARPTYFKIMSACIICCNLDSWSTLVLSGYLSKCIPSYSSNQLKASESVTKCKQSLHEDSDTPKSCWRRPIGERHSRLGGLAEWHRTFG